MSATIRTPSLRELLLTEHMDGDFLLGCGRSVGNATEITAALVDHVVKGGAA